MNEHDCLLQVEAIPAGKNRQFRSEMLRTHQVVVRPGTVPRVARVKGIIERLRPGGNRHTSEKAPIVEALVGGRNMTLRRFKDLTAGLDRVDPNPGRCRNGVVTSRSG